MASLGGGTEVGGSFAAVLPGLTWASPGSLGGVLDAVLPLLQMAAAETTTQVDLPRVLTLTVAARPRTLTVTSPARTLTVES